MPSQTDTAGLSPRSARDSYDMVVVGTGLIAAIVVRQYRDAHPDASVAMVDAGQVLSDQAGEHLITQNPERLDETYHRLMRAARQITLDRPTAAPGGAMAPPWSPVHGGLVPAQFAGHDMAQFPGAVMAWNVGGMGVHWTAACPWPTGPELVTAIPPETWSDQVAAAQRHLRVCAVGYNGNPFCEPILTALSAALPSPDPHRKMQAMPMAGITGRPGPATRTGPLDILPELDPGHPHPVALLPLTLCTQIVIRGDQVTGVLVRGVDEASNRRIRARIVVIAADALRTPQLLWTSGLGGPAVGRYLNEHACLSTAVPVDPTRLQIPDGRLTPAPRASPGEPFVGAYWYPSRGTEQPIHGQMMETSGQDGHTLRISVYAPTQIRAANRLEFSRTDLDRSGMPQMRAHFSYTPADLAVIETARLVQRSAARAISSTDIGFVELAPAGASLHYTGTTRMGPVNDGTSVCNTAGQVWGLKNLFVAGNAVVPTALTCNSTLTSAALAVGTGRAAAAVHSRASPT